jgi:hypothetical protein
MDNGGRVAEGVEIESSLIHQLFIPIWQSLNRDYLFGMNGQAVPFDNGKPDENRRRKVNGSKVRNHNDGWTTEKGGLIMKIKLFYSGLLLWIVLICIVMGQAVYAEDTSYIIKNGVSIAQLNSNQVDGSISLVGETQKEKIKLLVKKDKANIWLDVNVKDGKFKENIWLTQGTGNYTISVMIHEQDRKYSYGPTLNIENKKEMNKDLSPTKHVESDDEEIIKLANKITNVNDTELDKAKAIYQWVVENITYDYEKYSKHQSNDYDNNYGAVHTFNTKKGVCYDYATLTAALGRAAGIQTKVVKGEGNLGSFKGLHAWNEMYITEKGQWIPVDTTFGSTAGKDFFDNDDFYKSHTKTDEY